MLGEVFLLLLWIIGVCAALLLAEFLGWLSLKLIGGNK